MAAMKGSMARSNRMQVVIGLAVAVVVSTMSIPPLFADSGDVTDSVASEGGDQNESFDRLGIEEPTRLARAELVAGQTLHGVVLGMDACVILDCESMRGRIGAVTLGAGVGLGGSLLATGNTGVTHGQASAINSGVLWGAWLGFQVGDLAGYHSRELATVMATGQLGGMGLGYLLSEVFRPTAGDVALVNHSGLWSVLYFRLISEGILQTGFSPREAAMGLIFSSIGGGLGGVALASQMPMSRGRVVVMSSSGLLGGLVGAAIPALALGENPGDRALMTGITLGTAGGLLTAGYLTRTWDGDEYRPESAALGIQPTVDGEGMLGTVSGRF